VKYDPRDDDLDADMDVMDVAELCLQLKYFRSEARKMKLKQGNARCHENEREFYRTVLPEGDEGCLTALADKPAFLAQCERYWETSQCPAEKGRHTCPHCGGSGIIPPTGA
jgi:hypothetical protein